MTVNEIIEKCSLNEDERREFEKYLINGFEACEIKTEKDNGFLTKWREIYVYAEENSAAEALNKFVTAKRPVNFSAPADVKLELYNSFAGEIPVICIKNSNDFETFLISAVYKGVRPENLSETGASFASGKTTRFITLSAKPYSNVPASDIGLSESEWSERSMIIRREHECTHYFTKQTFGLSRNHLHDELLADFFGLYEAFGEYRSEYFLRFMGIVGESGGRLRFYTDNLSEKVCSAVAETARYASEYLERYSKTEEFMNMSREQRVIKLCRTSLAEMCNANYQLN